MFFLLFLCVSVFVCERCSLTHVFTAVHLLKFIYAILLFTFVQMTLFPGSLPTPYFTNLPKKLSQHNGFAKMFFFCLRECHIISRLMTTQVSYCYFMCYLFICLEFWRIKTTQNTSLLGSSSNKISGRYGLRKL